MCSLRECLREWIDVMEQSPGGEAILSNILYDCTEHHLPPGLIREFFENLQDALGGGESVDILKVFFTTTHNPDYLCRGSAITNLPQLSRVVEANSFIRHNVEFLDTAMEVSSVDSTLLEQCQLLEGSDSSTFGKKTLGNARGFAWVTQTEVLKNLRELTSPSQLATVVRDSLGLCNFQSNKLLSCYPNELLLEVVYPQNIHTSLVPVVFPTFIEGVRTGGFSFYRSQRCNGWGRTVRLDDPNDGLPEAVHRSIPFEYGFKVRIIGVSNSTEQLWAEVEESFLEGFPRRWTESSSQELINFLEALFNNS
jgi:hypothetical protein